MKPDWKDAPEWANYLAQDEDGEWHWYKGKPFPVGDGWWPTDHPIAKAGYDRNDWEDTLEQRP